MDSGFNMLGSFQADPIPSTTQAFTLQQVQHFPDQNRDDWTDEECEKHWDLWQKSEGGPHELEDYVDARD